MKRETGIVSVLAIMVLLSSCGGGSSASSASSPYTGLTSAAVITDDNADEIALAAFQGGDLGANAVVPFAPSRDIAVLQPPASPTARSSSPPSIGNKRVRRAVVKPKWKRPTNSSSQV